MPRLFMTGASGFVGSVITEKAVAQGYTVHGLSRSEANDEKLRALGAVPVRGDLTSLDVLRKECTEADQVIHLATAYVFPSPTYETAWPTDKAALEVMAEALEGTGKPLVSTSGTLIYLPDPSGGETNEDSPQEPKPLNSRGKAETFALSFSEKNVRATSVRLAPYVYGRGGSGIARFMNMGAKTGFVTTIDGGKNHTTVVHVDDAASLYLLVAQKGKAGEVYNASGSTDLTAAEIYGAIAEEISVPVKDFPADVAKAQFGEMVTFFLKAENRASSAKARSQLGWQPEGMSLLDEIRKGSYQEMAKALRKSD